MRQHVSLNADPMEQLTVSFSEKSSRTEVKILEEATVLRGAAPILPPPASLLVKVLG